MEEKDIRKMTAVDWLEKRYNHSIKNNFPFKDLDVTYEKAVWVDANLNGGCVVDPWYSFHFYEEEDAVAFKLRWE